MLSRAAEITASQRKLEEAEQEATRALVELRETMKGSAERFELENRSLDAVSERIAELRSDVTECRELAPRRWVPCDAPSTRPTAALEPRTRL